MSELAMERGNVYKILSMLYLKPLDSKMRDIILSWNVEGHIDKHIEKMKNILREGNEERLAIDFTHLLRGIRPVGPQPPYESVYIGEGRVFGDVTSEVKREYNTSGLALSEEWKGEPPDHIGIELYFMAHLCSLNEHITQKKFLEEHLLKWFEPLYNEIRKHDKTGFYASIAEITKWWLRGDYDFLLSKVRSKH